VASEYGFSNCCSPESGTCHDRFPTCTDVRVHLHQLTTRPDETTAMGAKTHNSHPHRTHMHDDMAATNETRELSRTFSFIP
jgi:hypothetical protein